jgi:outer membrane protein TolC
MTRLGLLGGLLLLGVVPLAGQSPAPFARRLSLEEALQLARPASEPVGLARAAVARARGEQYRARSELFPQLTGSASYSRLIKSQFEGFATDDNGSGPAQPTSCARFFPDPSLPIAARVDSLEKSLECVASLDPFGDLGSLPFGRANTYNLGLSLSQTLFAGGRVRGQLRAADAGRRSAEIGLTSADANLTLSVVETYFDAVLADQLATIAKSALDQADSTLRQTQLRREVGTAPEFDLLRARVTRDNQRAAAIQRESDRDLAHLRLKQLLELPSGDSLALVTALDDSALAGAPSLTALLAAAPDTVAEHRAPVRQAVEAVNAREGLLKVARSQHLPSVALTSGYSRVAYPGDALPSWSSFLTNWSVAVGLTLPIFTGGRIKGDKLVASADLDQARLQLRQTAEGAELDARSSSRQLRTATEALRASEGTAEQAERAYRIAEVRYAEGISTQNELLDARLALEVARGNRAQASRDAQVARVRMALIANLPLAGAGSILPAAARAPQRAPTPQQSAAPAGTGFP